jgi:hypothetical protein
MSGTGKTTIELPPGCYGMEMPDGREINGKPGSKVDVPDHYVPAIKASTAGVNGILTTDRSFALGTRRGQRCTNPECGFLAQAWAKECPRCESLTQEEWS